MTTILFNNKNKTTTTEKPQKHRILFMGEGVSVAHVTRALVLSEQLDGNEFEIHFATAKRFHYLITNPKIILYDIETEEPTIFYEKIRTGKPLFNRTLLKKYIKADQEILDKCQPDVVVSDFRISMSLSCELRKTPFITLANGYWSPYTTIKTPVPEHPISNFLGKHISRIVIPFVFPIVFKKNIQAFIQERKELGLKPLKHSFEAYSGGDKVLYLDLPELTPTRKLPDNHEFIGPVLWEPDISLPNWPLDNYRKTVYLTLGSSGGLDNTEELIDQLLHNNFQVITTCAVKKRKHVYSEKFLPGLKIARLADVFICHGGSGTVYQALSAGLPIIGVCSNLDQQMVLQTLEQKGVAQSILKKNASAKKLLEMTLSILDNKDLSLTRNYFKNLVKKSNAKLKFVRILKETCLQTKQQKQRAS